MNNTIPQEHTTTMDNAYKNFRFNLEEEDYMYFMERLDHEEYSLSLQLSKTQKSVESVKRQLDTLKEKEGEYQFKTDKSKFDDKRYLEDIRTLITMSKSRLLEYKKTEDTLMEQLLDNKYRKGYVQSNINMIQKERDELNGASVL